ncbi:MAG: prephenate dehydrogenase/arogenate dehydrogenase family protein [bacterium]
MKKIAIIGLGLIGTSLLKALQNKGYELYGISKNPETIKKAIEQKLVIEASINFDLIKNMDVIFIATPMGTVIDTIEKIKNISKKDAIIADLASVKGFILDYVNNLDTKLNFIGLHPMAGNENKGFDSAEDALFQGAKWAIIPSDFAQIESTEFIVNLIKNIGSKPIFTDAKNHDQAVAMVSHMPMILAQTLFKTADDDLSKKLAASGFRDMTRLAMSNSQMAKDMLKFNKENIKESLSKLKTHLNELLENYENENLDEIINQRKNMYSEEGKNNF